MDILLNGKRHKCPSCWEEVSTETYQRIMAEWDMTPPAEERDYFHLFCILTGADFKSFEPSPELEVTIQNAIGWFINTPFEPGEKPKVLMILSRPIEIPENVGSLSIGQNIAVRQILSKCKYLEQGVSMAMAIFLQPLITKEKFKLKQAKELEPEIAKLPIHLTYPIGFFLLANVLKTGSGSTSLWRRIRNSLILMSAKVLRSSPRSAAFKLTMILILLTSLPNDSALTLIGCIGKAPSSLSQSF